MELARSGFQQDGTHRTDINTQSASFTGQISHIIFTTKTHHRFQATFCEGKEWFVGSFPADINASSAKNTAIGIIFKAGVGCIHLGFFEVYVQLFGLQADL